MSRKELSTNRNEAGRSSEDFQSLLMKVFGPALIMLMVGSLVFFLIEIMYRGPHAGRLRWVFGLFTFATVLVSRISIEEGKERAGLFGFALAFATFVVSIQLVKFEFGLAPFLILLFIVVVMWSANRLTWDCTVIGDSRDVSAIGLAEIVRRKLSRTGDAVRRSTGVEPKEHSNERPRSGNAGNMLLALLGQSGQRNTPGLWVFYFSVAAFPIFGFGQWLATSGSFGTIFLLFAVYLGSGLGLLMLTSLMGLQRYLKQRGAVLPPGIGRSWLVVGTVFALLVMLFVMVLPRPDVASSLSQRVQLFTSPFRGASEHGMGSDGQEERKNAANKKSGDRADAPKSADAKSRNPAKGDRQSDQGKPSDGQSKKQNDGSNNKSDSQARDPQGGEQKTSDGSNGKNNQESAKEDSSTKDGRQDDRKGPPGSEKRQRDQERADKSQEQDSGEEKSEESQTGRTNNRPPARQPNNPTNSPSNSPSNLSKVLAGMMKWIVYLVGIVALLVAIWMFRDELAEFWNSLFARKPRSAEEPGEVPTPRPEIKLPPFGSFQNPFANGQAGKLNSKQLLQYTFSAVEAWGRESGIERASDDTPHEFARAIYRFHQPLGSQAAHLADLYSQALYSRTGVTVDQMESLRKIWQLLAAVPPGKRQQPEPLSTATE